jgi:hypothetical protein
MAHECFSTSDCHFEDPAVVWREQHSEVPVIGQTISQYTILEKPPSSTGQVGEGGMSPAYLGGTSWAGRQISPRTCLPDRQAFCVSGWNFEPARPNRFTVAGGNPDILSEPRFQRGKLRESKDCRDLHKVSL